MAVDTPPDVRSLVIYQVFPRNYGPTGMLPDITADLDRIVALGADVLYLMPIHPIGVEGRKGSEGSPYAISDFRVLHPDLGTDRDFDELVSAAHEAGLKVVIDVVLNHTSPDSVLVSEHPELFHRDADGRPVTSVPEWSDIIDLKHPDHDLTRYLIDCLALWVRRGVDGFRCDVASFVPVELWVQARSELARLKPGLLWIAESVSPDWVSKRRARGLPTWSDSELFEAFDIEYHYDLFSIWQAAVDGQVGVGRVLEMLRWQDGSCIQVAWAGMPADGRLGPVTEGGAALYGVFNVGGVVDEVAVQLADGQYPDLLTTETVTVAQGRMAAPDSAVVLELAEPFSADLGKSALLDVSLHVEVLGDPDV